MSGTPILHPTITRLQQDGPTLSSYAWPGGYPIFYLTADNAVLCPQCANNNLSLTNDSTDPQWYIIACDVNWEDPSLYCDNCSQRIESAYAENELEEITND